jgi:hypothetical protein
MPGIWLHGVNHAAELDAMVPTIQYLGVTLRGVDHVGELDSWLIPITGVLRTVLRENTERENTDDKHFVRLSF